MQAVVSFSGGMDSATLLWALVHNNSIPANEILAVNFTYGAKHNAHEREMAIKFSHHVGCKYREIDITPVLAGFKSDLLTSGGDIPEGHYEARSMERTVVPARNMIFATILAGIAWTHGVRNVHLGIHAGDHAIYPDCRPDFYAHMKAAVEHGTGDKVTLQAPFLYLTKANIVKVGTMGPDKVPYRLTRTCYTSKAVACGKCGSCQERLASFAEHGLTDPLDYESRDIFPKEAK